MSQAAHKLCDILNEYDADVDEEIETGGTDDLEEEEVEVWQFDPGICG